MSGLPVSCCGVAIHGSRSEAAGSSMGELNRAGSGGDNPAADEVARVGYRVDGSQSKLPISLIQLCFSRNEWCPGAESNHRHRDFQSRALPTELPGRGRPGGARLRGPRVIVPRRPAVQRVGRREGCCRWRRSRPPRRQPTAPGWRRRRAASATGRRPRSGASRTAGGRGSVARRRWDSGRAACFLCRQAPSGAAVSPLHSISLSADLTHAKCTGKPSPVSSPTASVSGSPTTLV